jgi:hypothetical protein
MKKKIVVALTFIFQKKEILPKKAGPRKQFSSVMIICVPLPFEGSPLNQSYLIVWFSTLFK